MTVKLSICIATYNRAKFIGETLESILPQVTEEVEIVIVDGASTDNTEQVMHHYLQMYNCIHYVRLPTKGGVDQDYCKAVEFAKGEYCWFFTDDDLLKPNAINTVLSEVKKGYSLIIINFQVRNGDFLKILEEKRLQICENEIYNELQYEKLFHRIVLCISFIGCVVINRDMWQQREKKQYLGTEFIHVGVIFQAPFPAPALVIAEPQIIIRYGNAQWTPRAFEIWMFKWPNLINSFVHISEKTRIEQQMKNPFKKLSYIISSRARGEYSMKEYLKWFASKDTTLWFRITALFIAVLPCFFVNFIMLSYLKMVRKEKILSIYNLENNKYNIIKLMRLKKKKEVICI